MDQGSDPFLVFPLPLSGLSGFVLLGLPGAASGGSKDGFGDGEEISMPETGRTVHQQPAFKRGAKPGDAGYPSRVSDPFGAGNSGLIRQPFRIGSQHGIRKIALGKAS